MKKMILLLILSSTLSFAQNSRVQEMQSFQTSVTEFWRFVYQQENRPFYPPKIVYTDGLANLYYSYKDRNITISADIVRLMFDNYNNAVYCFAFAHEFGHFIQHDKDKTDVVSIFREYQADCLSGYFFQTLNKLGYMERQDIPYIFKFIDDISDKKVRFRDLFSLDSHGSADGRKQAFSLGFTTNNYQTCLNHYNTKEIFNR